MSEEEKTEVKKLRYSKDFYKVEVGKEFYFIEVEHENKLIREIEISLNCGRVEIPAKPLKAILLLIQQEGFKL
jgi:hypothetical protein